MDDLIVNGRLTFDPRIDKTAEKLAARLLENETNLDKLHLPIIINQMNKKKRRFYYKLEGMDASWVWFIWRESYSSCEEFYGSRNRRIIAVSYKYVGNVGDIDGRVLGDYKGVPIYVLIEFKHNIDGVVIGKQPPNN